MNPAQQFTASQPATWKPAIPLFKIARPCIDSAEKLRRALRRVLTFRDNENVSRVELERMGLEDYRREVGQTITDRYLRKLVKRTLDRAGEADLNRLEIYLPDRLTAKDAPARAINESVNEEFAALESLIEEYLLKPDPSEADRDPIWKLALLRYQLAVANGENPKRVARRLRLYLFSKASFLAPSRDALLKTFNRRFAGGTLEAAGNGRKYNGDRFIVPEEDVRRLRHSIVNKNGDRFDAAWREEYTKLTQATRDRYPFSRKMPRNVREQVNRTRTDALCDGNHGDRTLRSKIGGVKRKFKGVPSMVMWGMDDNTGNIETFHRDRAGKVLLFKLQLVAVMDSASRKITGYALSEDPGPTAELCCDAIRDAATKERGVALEIGLENGFVFGKSLNINGKEDDEGRTLVAGFAAMGCALRRYGKMNPRAKAELEKGFDLLQRLMERHPGYAGRIEMLHASEKFKRDKRAIQSGHAKPENLRYTPEELVQRYREMIEEYNRTPQYGHLNGISPNEAHELMKDPKNPHIGYSSEMEWWLRPDRYGVTVLAGGVKFRHFGNEIRVRGGRLAQLIGDRLWALPDRSDPSIITFMSLNFRDVFTMEVCKETSPNERLLEPGSGVLASELSKISETVRAVREENKQLVQEFGDVHAELLAEIRGRTVEIKTGGRPMHISGNLLIAGKQMQDQVEAVKEQKREKANRSRNLRGKAARAGVPAILVDDGDEDMREALELRLEAQKEHALEQQRESKQSTEGNQ